MRIGRLVSTLLSVAAVGLMAAACAGSGDAESGDAAPTTAPSVVTTTVTPGESTEPTTPTATVTATPSTPVTTAVLPVAFPIPTGASLSDLEQDVNTTTATITLDSASSSYEFWTAALPAAGYTVTDAQGRGGLGSIRFSGHGCGGDSGLVLTGISATMRCEH